MELSFPHHDRRLPLLRTIHVPCVLPSLPRWNRQLRISLASPTTATFPVILAGRLPHWLFRGLLNVHSRCGPHGPLTPTGPFYRSASDHSSPPDPLRSLPAGARVCRPGFPPGRTMRLAKAHRTIGPRIRINRHDDASARCNASNRPVQPSASCRFTPPSSAPSTSSAISHPAIRSASSETKHSGDGKRLPLPKPEPALQLRTANLSSCDSDLWTMGQVARGGARPTDPRSREACPLEMSMKSASRRTRVYPATSNYPIA